MPLKIIPIGNDRYSVVNIETGKVHSYDTTLENAKKQVSLIDRVDNNLLMKVIKKMKSLKIPFESVELSDRPNKKIKVVICAGPAVTPKSNRRLPASSRGARKCKIIHFGDKNSKTYLEGADKQKRDAYRARASKIKNKIGEYTYLIPYTPNFLAYHVLW